ncbi:MAG TPA: hypothetical protein VGB84_04610, partial [Arachidicoccus sp.]
THHYPIHITPQDINGINIPLLETQLHSIDRNDYSLSDIQSGLVHEKEVIEVFDKLKILSESSTEGKNAVDLLYAKYLPDAFCNQEQLALSEKYIHTIELKNLDEDNLLNANLLYHIVTGHVNKLESKLERLIIPQFGHEEIAEAVKDAFSTERGAFNIEHSYFDGESKVTMFIPVVPVDTDFQINRFYVSVKDLPEPEHGIYNEVDSFVLLQKMSGINWEKGPEWLDEKGAFKSTVNEILEMLEKISNDERGAQIASNLKLQFWLQDDFFRIMLNKNDWSYLEAIPSKEAWFNTELSVFMTVNLLKGNPVYLWNEPFRGQEIDGWLLMDTNAVTEFGTHPIEYITDYSIEQLEAALKMLPIPNHQFYHVRDRLLNGYRVNATLNDGMNIYIKADPQNNTLRIYDELKREISFNFNLDVHWQPSVRLEENVPKITPEMSKQKSIQPFDKHKSKRKGHRL